MEKSHLQPVLFTVVTVCRNSRDVIGKTIESVLAQTYPHMEYLIIDGNSTDDTVQLSEKYRKKFEKKGFLFKIISEPDHGIYDAMNKGIRMSSGELIGFINAGDWYEPDAVKTAAIAYKKTHFDYFYADIKLAGKDGKIRIKHSKIDGIFPTSRHWNHPSGFVRKKLYRELGEFKCIGIHDDFEFFLRVKRAGKKITVVNRVLANFVTGGISNEKNADMCRKRIADRYRSYRDNGYSPLCILECAGIEAVKYLLY